MAYRNVSGAVVFEIAGEIHIDLLAFERRRSWKMNRENIAVSSRWSEEINGTCIGRLILSIDAWIRSNFGEINYFLTQFPSGHSYFRQYL